VARLQALPKMPKKQSTKHFGSAKAARTSFFIYAPGNHPPRSEIRLSRGKDVASPGASFVVLRIT
jgi:hypothetical protein